MTDGMEAPRLLSLAAVKDRTSLSEMSIRRLVERRKFPVPVRLSANRIAWREPDVCDWINSRAPVAA